MTKQLSDTEEITACEECMQAIVSGSGKIGCEKCELWLDEMMVS